MIEGVLAPELRLERLAGGRALANAGIVIIFPIEISSMPKRLWVKSSIISRRSATTTSSRVRG